jgi:hypothetical protein
MNKKIPIITLGALLLEPFWSRRLYRIILSPCTIVEDCHPDRSYETVRGPANHAELHFYLLQPDRKGIAKTPDGKYVEWGVEMAGAAAVAQQGITTATFPVGTVFSVRLNPLRDGSNFGSRTGLLPVPDGPGDEEAGAAGRGKHCDSVPGTL